MVKLGVDIGGVIIDRVGNSSDTGFQTERYLETPEVPGAIEALGQLTSKFDEIYLVSRCGIETELKTKKWLEHHDFYERTQIQPGNVYFCRERYQKAEVATRLGLSHFIDDRLEVLSYLEDVPHRVLINWRDAEVEKYRESLADVQKVGSWAELLEVLA